MADYARMYPRRFSALQKTDEVVEAFIRLVVSDPLLKMLWLLAMEQVATEQRGAVLEPDIRPTELLEQKAIEWLHRQLVSSRIPPMDQLVSYVQFKAPAFAAWTGQYLKHDLVQIMIALLDGRSPEQVKLQAERISPDNPIVLEARTDDHITVTIPIDASSSHLLEVESYRHSLRDPKPRGRSKKSPSAPKQHTPRHTDAEAIKAWDMTQQGHDWPAIARALWPGSEFLGDAKMRDAVSHKVQRRIDRGRLLDAMPKSTKKGTK
jgi:hypothetical protein